MNRYLSKKYTNLSPGSFVIKCNTCGRQSNLNYQHIKNISDKFQIEIAKINNFILPQLVTAFKCIDCGEKNAAIIAKSKLTAKSKSRKKTLTSKPKLISRIKPERGSEQR